jgi:hypothetical protein
MGNPCRFIEPGVPRLLQIKSRSCGYNLCSDLQTHALTNTEIDKAALYLTLRQLKANGNVKSAWETGDSGSARGVYPPPKEAGPGRVAQASESLRRTPTASVSRC